MRTIIISLLMLIASIVIVNANNNGSGKYIYGLQETLAEHNITAAQQINGRTLYINSVFKDYDSIIENINTLYNIGRYGDADKFDYEKYAEQLRREGKLMDVDPGHYLIDNCTFEGYTFYVCEVF